MLLKVQGDITVFLHESGHSLDLLGAYPDKPFSSSANWINNYNLDSNVPDPYSDTNLIEDVAQVTVISSFDMNVPGGLGSIDSKHATEFHQYATLEWEAKQAGGLLVPGEKGSCTHRLANSPPVPQSHSKRMVHSLGHMPNVTLSHSVKVIPPKEFDTSEACKRSF